MAPIESLSARELKAIEIASEAFKHGSIAAVRELSTEVNSAFGELLLDPATRAESDKQAFRVEHDFKLRMWARKQFQDALDSYLSSLEGLGLTRNPQVLRVAFDNLRETANAAAVSWGVLYCLDVYRAARGWESASGIESDLKIEIQKAEQKALPGFMERVHKLEREQLAVEVPSSTPEAPRSRAPGDTKHPNRVAMIFGRDVSAMRCIETIIKVSGLEPFDFIKAKRERQGVGHDFNHELIDELFKNCGTAVVILTGDEEAGLIEGLQKSKKDADKRTQPRPNVLFEFGFALGRYDRDVIVVQFGTVESCSDLHGLHPYLWKDAPSTGEQLHERFGKMGLPVTPVLDKFSLVKVKYVAPRKPTSTVLTKKRKDEPALKPSPPPYSSPEPSPPLSPDPESLPWAVLPSELFNSDPQRNKLAAQGYTFIGPILAQVEEYRRKGYDYFLWRSPVDGKLKRISNGLPLEIANVWMVKPPSA